MRKLAVCCAVFTVLACDDKPKELQVVRAVPERPADDLALTGLKRLALETPQGDSRIDKQIVRLQNVVKRYPAKLDPWVLLGRSWVQKARQESEPGYYKNANACADIGLDILPENPLSQNLKGLVLMNDHRFEDAKVLMQKLLEKDSDDIMALGTLSDAELELGNFDVAVKHAQRMIDLKPSLPAYTRAAYLKWLVGDVEGATTLLKKSIMAAGTAQEKETFAWVLVEAAKIFWHKGDHAGADAGLTQAFDALPDHPGAWVWRARIQLAKGEAKAALASAKKSYEGAALAETAWVWIDAARAAGDEAEAKIAEAKLLKLGEHGEARVLALYYATENKLPKRAVELAERELKGRGDIYTYDAYAWALYRAERYDEALAAAERANRHGTPDANLLFHLGAIQIAAGQTAKGKANVKKAVELNPRFHPKAYAEAKALLAK